MEEKQKTEIGQALPQDARDKLSEITGRLRFAKESIDRISTPEKTQSSILGMFIAILSIPVILLLFGAATVLALWLITNPLNTMQMYGISIFLIGCYVVFLTPKRPIPLS